MWAGHYNALYGALGVPATISEEGTDGFEVDVTVIDKTSGIEVGDDVGVSTIKPVAAIRMTEVTAKGLSRERLNEASITFNDGTWTIESNQPKPSPAGEAQGELYLILSAV